MSKCPRNHYRYAFGLSGLGASAYDQCKQTIATYPSDYVFGGSQFSYSAKTYLPVSSRVDSALTSLANDLANAGFQNVQANHTGGFSEGILSVRVTVPIDMAKEAHVQGLIEGAARNHFYFRSGPGTLSRTYRPDPCAAKDTGESGSPGGGSGGSGGGNGWGPLLDFIKTPMGIAVAAVVVYGVVTTR